MSLLLTLFLSLIYLRKLTSQHHPFDKVVIVAGAQKSGTTVLAAYLAAHPNITFPSSTKKELHFFDKNTSYSEGITKFKKEFHPTSNTIMIGEATPYYMASPYACKRIAHHFPKVKMIILLRNPILRAYSEYQMKVRRVIEQEEFFKLVNENAERVVKCLREHPESYSDIAKCFPVSISQHARYSKFTKALKTSMKSFGDWENVIQSCFDLPPKFMKTQKDSRILSSTDTSQTICSVAAADDRYVPTPSIIPSITNETASAIIPPAKQLLFSNAKKRIELLKQKFFAKEKRVLLPEFSSSTIQLNPKKCWQFHKPGYEYVKPIRTAFLQEIETFQHCAKKQLKGTDMFQDIETLDMAVHRCIKIRGGISQQYFYRSMYAAQLYNCYQSIDPSQFLILSSEEMRDHPQAVLLQVLQFLEVPISMTWIHHIIQQNAQELVSSKFSSFEKTTGWKLHGSYDEIPSHLYSYLYIFYKEQNDLLFQMIGKNFTQYWQSK